ncbi:MAG: hypothetical protein Q8909_05340 [Bacteroidota bacterium]|nr:hypothetical protein [Bacteroidota bacterium]
MNKSDTPNARYASLTSLEELRIEKLKLLGKMRRQEEQIKRQVDDYLDIFRWIGYLSMITKQAISTIPYFKWFRIAYKFISLFWKK